jgi:hypothetical protein
MTNDLINQRKNQIENQRKNLSQFYYELEIIILSNNGQLCFRKKCFHLFSF